MKRLIVLLGALLALVTFGSACSSPTANAATVNGTDIKRSSLVDEADAFAALSNDPFQLKMSGDAANEGAYSPSGMAGVLKLKITDTLVAQTAKKHNIDVNQQDIDAVKSGDLADYSALPAAKLDDLARRIALQNNVFAWIGGNQWWNDADIQRYYDMNKDTSFTQACTKHILVSDEGAANQILNQLRNGGDFKALAAANSIDTSNKDQGGELGCLGKGQLVSEYENAVANAKDGDLVGPVKTDFGYHIIYVESTYAPQPLDKVHDQIVETFSDSQGQGWAQYTLATANIKVDRRYGTWNKTTFDIDLPEGAQTNTPNVVNPG